MMDYTDTHRWAFGTMDIYGMQRLRPELAGVLIIGSSIARLYSGDPFSVFVLEVGARAASYSEELDDVWENEYGIDADMEAARFDAWEDESDAQLPV